MTDKAVFDLEKFERLEIDPAAFGHFDHIKAAYAMLEKYGFVEACARYSATIQAMTELVGVTEKFNATITIAFMSVIAERRSAHGAAGWDAFLAANADLLDKDLLGAWYSKGRLFSALARRQFLLPDKAGATAGSAMPV